MTRVYLDEHKPNPASKLIPPAPIHPGASLGTEAVWIGEGQPYGEWLLAVEQGEDRVRDAHRNQGEICARCRQAAPWHRGALVIHRLRAKTSTTAWACGLCLLHLPGTELTLRGLRAVRVPRLLFPGFREPGLIQSALAGPGMPWIIEAARTFSEHQVFPREPGIDVTRDKSGDPVPDGAILEARKKYAERSHVSVLVFPTQNLCDLMGCSAGTVFVETQDQAWARLIKLGYGSAIPDYFQKWVATHRPESWPARDWHQANAAIGQIGQDLQELFMDGLSIVDVVEPWMSVSGRANLDRQWDVAMRYQPPPTTSSAAEGKDERPDNSVQ